MERYFESKRNAISLRKELLRLQNEHFQTDEIFNESNFGILRYFYYIHEGVDLVNIASADMNWIDGILSKIPSRFKKKKQIDGLLTEINEMFLFAVRKSVVDFTFQDLTDTKTNISSLSMRVTPVMKISLRLYRFQETKSKIFKNLFTIHPVVVKISQMWAIQYSNLRIINVDELKKSESIDLNVFRDWLSSQIEHCKNILLEKWIPFVFKVVLRAIEKNFRDTPKRKLNRFYDCLSTLMTLQLQNLYLQTMNEYTDFICNPVRKATFQVRVLYKNKKIMFSPAYKEFRSIVAQVYSNMTNAISNCIPRIETKLYPQNSHIDETFLKPFILPEVIQNCRNKVEETLEDEWIGPELKIQDFDEYICLINGQSKIEVNKFLSENRPLEMFKEKVSYYHELGIEISLSCSRVITIGLFDVHREHFVTILVNKSQATKNRFLSKIMDTYEDGCKCLTDEFQAIKDYLLKAPANTAELVQKKEFNLNLGTKVLFDMEERLRITMRNILFCSDYVPFTSSQIKQNAATFLCYRRISDVLEENRNIIEAKTIVFQDLLKEKIKLFRKDLEKYRKQVEEFKNYGEAGELPKLLKKARALYKKFQIAGERIEEFNAEEIAFGWRETKYAEKDESFENLLPYKKLYETCVNYKDKHQIWTEAKIGTYMPEDIENDVLTYHHYIVELSEEFSSIPAPFALTNSIKQDVENFLKRMPIVKTLGNPRLKDRHWEKISEIVGFPLRADDDLTLAKILDFGLEEYASKFDIISDSATKENGLEMKLNEMMAEWKDMKFRIEPYRDTGAYVLTNVRDVQTLLDDHIVKTHTMKNSSYIKPFESTIRSWEDKLMFLQEILDSWLLVQNMWLYVEPIFALGDIQQLMHEGWKRFSVVDKIWKDITKATSENTSVLAVINLEKFLERLHKCVSLLDQIHYGFTSYLQTKRMSFPRFFFLADREILDIISNGRDPRRVEQFMKKCFDCVAKIRFTSDLEVVALVSETEQELRLCEPIETVCHRGQVEKWLANVEEMMKKTIFQNMKSAFYRWDGEDNGGVLASVSEPQQIVCVINRIAATSKMEKNLDDTVLLGKYLRDELDVQIENIIISLYSHDVETNTRYNLVSLLIQQMEIREHTRRLLDESDYFVREAEFRNLIRCRIEDNGVYFSIHDCNLEYGYEFIGNYTPIVITPSVDRCYKSFFSSIKCNYGISLTGPDSIGKTETLNNFAKLVARPFVIFNCARSHRFEVSLIENLFKGVVSSHTWLCFDGFDAMKRETLEIVEHYVLKIQQAILLNEDYVKITNTSLKLQPNCIVFATTSAVLEDYRRYDNLSPFLRTVFHTVVLNEQDYEKLLRTKLQVLGCKEYFKLASKLNAVMKIASQVLRRGTISYFKNDLRVFASILRIVENNKRLYPNVNDESIVSHSVTVFCRSTFHPADWSLFEKILDFVFGRTSAIDLKAITMDEMIREACIANNFVIDESITQKVSHLVRVIDNTTGIMLVGRAGTGKSSITKILASTLASLEQNSDESTPKMVHVNPKSITLDQLYGHRDRITNKWIDGVLTSSYREFSHENGDRRKWLILDGPANVSWIENLNAVLDENAKKLCLNNGETISLSRRTNLFFETATLDYVSPSTISRCFVSYFEENFVRWEYLIDSWLNKAFSKPLIRMGSPSIDHDQYQRNHIRNLASRYFCVLFYFFDGIGDAGFTYAVTKNHIIESFCDIFDCLVNVFRQTSGDIAVEDSPTVRIDIRSLFEGIFFFSCIWSAGALLNKAYKKSFDVLFRALLCREFPADVQKTYNLPDELFEQATIKLHIPVQSAIPDWGTVFDYQYVINEGKGKWKLWMDNTALNCSISREIQFRDIIVPTKTTIRNHYLLSLLADGKKLFMLVGDTASGKTVDITNFLNTKLNEKEYEAIFFNFSTRTSANIVQNFVHSKLEKRKKGVFGPPLGMRYVFFFDDLNTTTKDEFNVSSAVELLRYWIEHKRWYNLDNSTPVELMDLKFLCACTTDTRYVKESTAVLCPRFSRHFNIFANDVFDDETLKSIYSKIMLWHLDTRGFSKEFDPCIEQIVDATTAIHRSIQKHLLPVPGKPHYVFNLRDFSKTIQGVVLSVPEAIEDLPSMKRLWVHEIMRVYHDRITDKYDSDWLIDTLKCVCASWLKIDLNKLTQYLLMENETEMCANKLRKLIFCDFINPKADVRNYTQVQDVEGLQSIAEGFLVEYNNVNKKRMNLLLFSYAIEHVSRICRVLKQPQGHVLLLGDSGCGKRSLTKLAIHICEYECFEIELAGQNDRFQYWREQMKNILFTVFTDQHSVILLTDIHVMFCIVYNLEWRTARDHSLTDFMNFMNLSDAMLEDVSNLLQNAVIPELFNEDDRKEIRENIAALNSQREKTPGEGDPDAETIFNMRVKKQIHVVLVFGWLTPEFRKCVEKFPSFVKFTTMDVFEKWSDEARSTLARKFLVDVNCEYDDVSCIINSCQRLYDDAKRIGEQTPMRVSFTQKSFIRLVTTFRHLYTKKYEWSTKKKQMLDEAVARLENLKEQTPILDKEYEALMPIIDERRNQIEKLKNEIEAEKEIEIEAEIIANGARSMAKKVEKKLNVIREMYDKELKQMADNNEMAVDSLRSLTSNDIAALKTMKNPPKCVRLVAEALAYIKDIRPEKIHEGGGKTSEDYWKPTLKAIGDSKFIESLCNSKISDVSSKAMYLLQEKIVSNEDFDSAKIKSYSIAAEAFYRWIMAVYEYNRLTKMDSDTKMELNRVEEEFANAKSTVNEKEKYLEESATRRKRLITSAEQGNDELERLMNEKTNCAKRKDRTVQLIRLLYHRKAYWSDEKRSIEKHLQTLTGDALLCAAILTYLTPLSEEYRRKMTREWWSLITNTTRDSRYGAGLRCRDDFAISDILLTDMEIELANLANISRNNFFYDNTAIIRNCLHYPLVVDAEGLMTDWIKNEQKEQNLVVIKTGREDYLRNLENAVTSGNVVLLENVEENLDAVLYNLFDMNCEIIKNSTSAAEQRNADVKMGNNTVIFNDKFKMFIVSEVENVNFSIELLEKLTIVNCDLTESSVENFLLETIIARDNHRMAEDKCLHTSHILAAKKAIIESEWNMVESLTINGTGKKDGRAILDSDDTVNSVETNVSLVDENSKKLTEINIRLDAINETIRKFYEPLAKHLAGMFEISARLRRLNGAYQFPLKWFENLIVSVTTAETTYGRNANENSDEKRHFEALFESFTAKFYTSVLRSLDEKDKLVFHYLWHFNDMKRRKMVVKEELAFFIECLREDAQSLTGNCKYGSTKKTNSTPNRIERLNDIFQKRPLWSPSDGSSASSTSCTVPNKDEEIQTTSSFHDRGVKASSFDENECRRDSLIGNDDKSNHFRKFLVKYCNNSDRIVDLVRELSMAELPNDESKRILSACTNCNELTTDFTTIYKGTDCRSPVAVIVLDEGDPMKEIFALAAHLGINSEKCTILNKPVTATVNTNCGKPIGNANSEFNTMKLIDDAKSTGSWIIIRNLNALNFAKRSVWLRDILAKSTTEKSAAAGLAPIAAVHPDFRLWLILDGRITYRNCGRILQNALVITYVDTSTDTFESSQNRSFLRNVRDELKSRLKLTNVNEPYFHNEEHVFEHLHAFHATLLRDLALIQPSKCQRRCDSNAVDFRLAFYQIRKFFGEHDMRTISSKKMAAVMRTILHAVYDAKMTDEHDRQIMRILLELYWNEGFINKINDMNSAFQPSIEQLRIIRSEISNFKRKNETAFFVEKLLSVHFTLSINDNYSKRQIACTVEDVQKIVNSIPATIKHDQRCHAEDIFTRAISNEITDFNSVVTVFRDACLRSIQWLNGQSALTNDLESFLHGLQNGRIVFKKKVDNFIVETEAEIDSWLFRMSNKNEFLQKLSKGEESLAIDVSLLEYPNTFFISKILQFYFTRCLQLDEIDFDSYHIIEKESGLENKLIIAIKGFYLENAVWNCEEEFPIINQLNTISQLQKIRVTCKRREVNAIEKFVYTCPVYRITKINSRNIDSTEILKNIFNISIQSSSCELLNEWILRRVKLIVKNYE